jgi:hypothetical protein
MDADAISCSNVVVDAFFEFRASDNPIALAEFLKELEQADILSGEEILAVTDAIMRAFERESCPTSARRPTLNQPDLAGPTSKEIKKPARGLPGWMVAPIALTLTERRISSSRREVHNT